MPWVLTVLILLGAWACAPSGGPPACPLAGQVMRLATTSSVENTGLLADLLPAFRARTGIEVQVLAVGTGQALKLAQNGDVDAVLVHDPESEQAFLEAGHGSHRQPLMQNDFVLLGPAGDPAGVSGARDAAEALARVAEREARFVSRGDGSGTHLAERRLWALTGLRPSGPWYLEVGQGQVAALRLADEKDAYCLTDRGTYLSLRAGLRLGVVFEGDPALVNVYSYLVVPPGRHPHARFLEAMALLGYLASTEGQARIGAFQAKGEVLFKPLLRPRPTRVP
jgi:tungstate transport system substrate-binding protein